MPVTLSLLNCDYASCCDDYFVALPVGLLCLLFERSRNVTITLCCLGFYDIVTATRNVMLTVARVYLFRESECYVTCL